MGAACTCARRRRVLPRAPTPAPDPLFFRVLVRSWAGEDACRLTLPPDAKVCDLKEAVEEACGVPAELQMLAVGTQALRRSRALLSDILPRPPAVGSVVLTVSFASVQRDLASNALGVKWQALRTVEQLGPRGGGGTIALLESVLLDTSWEVRRWAVERLRAVASPGCTEALALGRAALLDPHHFVRCAAAEALQGLAQPGCAKSEAALRTAALEDLEPDVRGTAAAAVWSIEGPAAAEPVMRSVMRDASRIARVEAVKALAALALPNCSKAFAVFCAAMQDEDEEVRKEAVTAIADTAVEGSAEALAALEAALHDDDLLVRFAGIHGLVKIAKPPCCAMVMLASASQDMFWQVRSAALEVLPRLAPPESREAVEIAIASLADEHWFVRASASRVLGALAAPSDAEALACLRAAARDKDRTVRESAAKALDVFSSRAMERPCGSLSDGDSENTGLLR